MKLRDRVNTLITNEKETARLARDAEHRAYLQQQQEEQARLAAMELSSRKYRQILDKIGVYEKLHEVRNDVWGEIGDIEYQFGQDVSRISLRYYYKITVDVGDSLREPTVYSEIFVDCAKNPKDSQTIVHFSSRNVIPYSYGYFDDMEFSETMVVSNHGAQDISNWLDSLMVSDGLRRWKKGMLPKNMDGWDSQSVKR